MLKNEHNAKKTFKLTGLVILCSYNLSFDEITSMRTLQHKLRGYYELKSFMFRHKLTFL